MYAKLFASILDSSLWSCDYPTRILFVTMIAMADREGYIYASRAGLARRACMNQDECDSALHALMATDEDSSDKLRNPKNEGRRVEEVPGGWKLLNYAYYRDLRDSDERRLQNRVAQRKFRSARVSNSQQPSASVSPSESESPTELESLKSKALGTPTRRAARVQGAETQCEGLTVDDALRTYAKGHGQDADALVDEWRLYYRSNGYLIGRNPMKDARSCFMRWIRNAKGAPKIAARIERPEIPRDARAMLALGRGDGVSMQDCASDCPNCGGSGCVA